LQGCLKTIKTSKAYTINELYETIKDKPFTAGQPSITKNGFAYIITFPPLDRQNQVQILSTALGNDKPCQKFQVQKGEQAGVDNMLINAGLDKLTGGLFGFGSVAGKTVKECEALVETTAKELEELGL
jgi:hypothetical protein